MTDRKISELTNITGANLADSDEFPVVDTSADETKAITFGELKTAFDTSTGFVRITGDTMTGDLTVPNVITSGNVDGRDVSADGTKLDTIETNADVTDTANVTSAGALMTTGGTLTGDVSFGDNDKAIFGAGSDLQIYHDGSDSFIDEAGTGNLRIRASSTINLQTRNAGDTAWVNSVIADDGLGVRLFTNGSKKLETTSTGIDVTGTVTADGLTVGIGDNIGVNSGNGFAIDASSNIDFTSGGVKSLRIKEGDISFYEDTGTTPKFFWDASAESLGIGTSSPNSKLTLSTGDKIFVPTGEALNFGHTDGSTNAEAMRIDSSGNLLVGQSSTTFPGATNTTTGHSFRDFGGAYHSASSNPSLSLNRNTSDGDIVQFRKDGTTVGSIGTTGGDLTVGTGGVRLRFNDSGDEITPRSSDDTGRDAAIDIGTGTIRFKDLYLSGGVYLGGTGPANKLDDYEEGTWTPAYAPVSGSFTTITYDTSVTTGKYIKIGTMVYVTGRIDLDSLNTSGASGVITVTGLPFAAYDPDNGPQAVVSIGSQNGWSNIPQAGVMRDGLSSFQLEKREYDAGAYSQIVASDMNTGNENRIFFSVCYNTA